MGSRSSSKLERPSTKNIVEPWISGRIPPRVEVISNILPGSVDQSIWIEVLHLEYRRETPEHLIRTDIEDALSRDDFEACARAAEHNAQETFTILHRFFLASVALRSRRKLKIGISFRCSSVSSAGCVIKFEYIFIFSAGQIEQTLRWRLHDVTVVVQPRMQWKSAQKGGRGFDS